MAFACGLRSSPIVSYSDTMACRSTTITSRTSSITELPSTNPLVPVTQSASTAPDSSPPKDTFGLEIGKFLVAIVAQEQRLAAIADEHEGIMENLRLLIGG